MLSSFLVDIGLGLFNVSVMFAFQADGVELTSWACWSNLSPTASPAAEMRVPIGACPSLATSVVC